jgi:hypothetical protein
VEINALQDTSARAKISKGNLRYLLTDQLKSSVASIYYYLVFVYICWGNPQPFFLIWRAIYRYIYKMLLFFQKSKKIVSPTNALLLKPVTAQKYIRFTQHFQPLPSIFVSFSPFANTAKLNKQVILKHCVEIVLKIVRLAT